MNCRGHPDAEINETDEQQEIGRCFICGNPLV